MAGNWITILNDSSSSLETQLTEKNMETLWFLLTVVSNPSENGGFRDRLNIGQNSILESNNCTEIKV